VQNRDFTSRLNENCCKENLDEIYVIILRYII